MKILVVSAIFITCMYYFDLYDSSVLSNRREVSTRLVQVLITVYAPSCRSLLRVSAPGVGPRHFPDWFSLSSQ